MVPIKVGCTSIETCSDCLASMSLCRAFLGRIDKDQARGGGKEEEGEEKREKGRGREGRERSREMEGYNPRFDGTSPISFQNENGFL